MELRSAHDGVLADQRAFYQARAPEYDEWWQRRGRYDLGPDDTVEWNRQVGLAAAALGRLEPLGDVLELAGGTGWWTEHLAHTADALTVLDSCDETLTINRQRVRRADVTYLVADIFTWQPERRYDTVFFSFWLSHVPRPLFETFWKLVKSCLRPAGVAFLIDNRDNRRDPSRATPDPYVVDEADEIQQRRLNDGSLHRVVKVFYEPDQLATQLRKLGWIPELMGTSRLIYGSAVRP